MKARLFINIHYLEIGGAETSLIGLLQALDPARVDVDLFVNDPRGEMLQYVPEWVNVLPAIPAYTMIERPLREVLRRGFVGIVVARLWAKVTHYIYMRRRKTRDGSAIFGYVGKYVAPLLPSLRHLGQYDLALSYLTPHNIVRDKVSAQKKVAWIHTDYSQIDVNARLELPVWQSYDNIISISREVTRMFCQVFPSLRSKIVEMDNILPAAMIRRRAAEPSPIAMRRACREQVVLLTIGRYCAAKKYEEIPTLCRRLLSEGIDVRWYIIGYGASDDYIRAAIRREGMEERVVLLGKQENPYPYIAACDWYVQPSRYEGKAITVREAQVLCKPVIITAYPTATAQVADGEDGVIVPLPIEECATAMARVLRDTPLRESIMRSLAAHDHSGREEVEKIYKLVG